MIRKENKGGVLTNEQIEQDLKVTADKDHEQGHYHGSQDTGDNKPRDFTENRQLKDQVKKEDK